MKMKRVTKKLAAAQQRFNRDVDVFIESLGGVVDERGCYHVQTPIGPLSIKCRENWIACRFKDHKAAHEWTLRNCAIHEDSNSRSGKWNFHFPNEVETLKTSGQMSPFHVYLNRLMDTKNNNED